MPTYRLRSLEELGPALQAYLDRAVPALVTALRDVIAEHAMVELVDRSPVGNPAVDPHPGKYRASHVPNAGAIRTVVLPNMPSYPLPGIPEVEAATRGAGPEVSVFIANAAADDRRPDSSYAGLLEPPKAHSKTQAPLGIYEPTIPALLGMRATLEGMAVERAKRRLG